MKKILILVMSCEQEFFNKQCDVIRETWGKPILENKYPNIEIIFFKGQDKPHTYNKKTHELLLRCEDDMHNTFKKTYYALSIAPKIFEYDYVFRTNTSTFVNVDLLNAFVQELKDDEVLWTSELYSLSEAPCPKPLDLYCRGNGILMSKKITDIILSEGTNFVYFEKTDDWQIGNIVNSYWIKKGENYLDHIKSYRHGWFKCIYNKAGNNNSICPYFNDNTDFNFLKDFITIQIKRYREREIENNNYYELWEIFSKNKDNEIEKAVEENIKYSKNPNVFIGSILGYIPYNMWVVADKLKLYNLEINNKASDDEERYKKKKPWY